MSNRTPRVYVIEPTPTGVVPPGNVNWQQTTQTSSHNSSSRSTTPQRSPSPAEQKKQRRKSSTSASHGVVLSGTPHRQTSPAAASARSLPSGTTTTTSKPTENDSTAIPAAPGRTTTTTPAPRPPLPHHSHSSPSAVSAASSATTVHKKNQDGRTAGATTASRESTAAVTTTPPPTGASAQQLDGQARGSTTTQTQQQPLPPPIPHAATSATAPSTTAPPTQEQDPASAGISSTAPIDPLSQHIFLRTNTGDKSISSRLRNPPPPPLPLKAENNNNSTALDKDGGLRAVDGLLLADGFGKDKKKGVSFLSRLSMRGNKSKKAGGDDDDEGSELSARPDGSNARVFSTAVSGGYIPHHKEPPRYIRTKAHHKKNREFDRMFLAQELVGTRQPLATQQQNSGGGSAKSPAASAITVVSATGDGGAKTTTEPAAKTGPNAASTQNSAPNAAAAKGKQSGAIWAAEFSKDGRYLAAAGRDQVVRVWAVISSPSERCAHREDESASGERLSAPVFREKPIREFAGHTGEVLDLSWSKNSFLLSTSMDKTVRLWHMSRPECLCAFRHDEFVSKVAFHPRDDRFFLAGCLDATLRLWSIPDKAVAFSAQTSDLITAVAFSPDGRVAIAGMLSGLCNFYDTEGLKLQSQLHVRSSRGKNAKGSKITGIQTAEILPSTSMRTAGEETAAAAGSGAVNNERSGGRECDPANVKVLITSTDARVRVYGLKEKNLDVKFKGHEHSCGQLCARFSDDGSYVVCPSEDRKAYIWSLGPAVTSSGGEDKSNGGLLSSAAGVSISVDIAKGGDKGPCESFAAHGSVVTTALFAPTRTRQLLGASGDPIYDLCNPPPVTLVSMGEAESSNRNSTMTANASQTALSEVPTMGSAKRAEESPGYISRSTHFDGNIIVTTDDTGVIKVFRQDCAYKRRREGWEASTSTLGRVSKGPSSAGLVGRTGSIMTRSSANSRRGSLSLSLAAGGVGSGPPSVASGAGGADHIMNWRQDVEGGGGGSVPGTPSRVNQERSERSASPTKPGTVRGRSNLASERRREPYLRNSMVSGVAPESPASSTFSVNAGEQHHHPAPPGAFAVHIGEDSGIAGPRKGSTASASRIRESVDSGVVASMPSPTSPQEGGGFWSLKWPKMPTLSRSIGAVTSSIPGFGGGKDENSKDVEGGGGGAGEDKAEANTGASGATAGGPAAPPQHDSATEANSGQAQQSATTKLKKSLDLSGATSTLRGGGGGGPIGAVAGRLSLRSRLSIGGAGEMTASEDDDETVSACRSCRAREFRAKKVGGKQRFLCARCGALVEDGGAAPHPPLTVKLQ